MITSFFKSIGKGLLNIVIIPAFLVGLALSAVCGIGVWFWELVKQIGRFFTGKSLNTDLPEDERAKQMIAEASGERPKENNIEVVQAEIADPIANYRELARQTATAKSIESKEDVDFILDDVPFEIDVSIQNEPKSIPTSHANNKPVEEDNGLPQIEEYNPKESKF